MMKGCLVSSIACAEVLQRLRAMGEFVATLRGVSEYLRGFSVDAGHFTSTWCRRAVFGQTEILLA